jgi:uncharacterized membrane protein
MNQLTSTSTEDDAGGATDKTAGTDKPESINEKGEGESEGGEKFLGMPKKVGITVVVVGGLALLVGGYFLIKKMNKK